MLVTLPTYRLYDRQTPGDLIERQDVEAAAVETCKNHPDLVYVMVGDKRTLVHTEGLLKAIQEVR